MQKRKTVPIPIQSKVYLFDLVNPEEFMNGGKPIVREMGPYVYK
jgi:scavenger receptor class B protein 1